jgi:hypothetical protein
VFLEYLHPINDNNTLLLTIGLDDYLGLQVSVLDVHNPAQPTVPQQYLMNKDAAVDFMVSPAWRDFHSVRYDPQTQRLILPLSISSYKNPSLDFEGFYVFIVNEHEIAPTCRINLAFKECIDCASLPYRSMIFRGNIMAMTGHFVTSVNLKSCISEWNFTLYPFDP